MTTRDPLSPQWEDCKVCGGDHWTKDHREHPFDQQRFDAETRQLKAGIRKRGEESEPYHTEAFGPSPDTNHIAHTAKNDPAGLYDDEWEPRHGDSVDVGMLLRLIDEHDEEARRGSCSDIGPKARAAMTVDPPTTHDTPEAAPADVRLALDRLRGYEDSIGRFNRDRIGTVVRLDDVLAVLGLAHTWPPSTVGDHGICADCDEFWPCQFATAAGSALRPEATP